MTWLSDCSALRDLDQAHGRCANSISKVTPRAAIHSTHVVVSNRSIRPSATLALEAKQSRKKPTGPRILAINMTGLSCRHSGSTWSRRHSGIGVKASTRNASEATMESVNPPQLFNC